MSRKVNKGFVCIWKIRHFDFYNSERDRCISTPVFATECLGKSKWRLHFFHDGFQVGCYITHEGPRKSDTEISVRYELTNPEGVILTASEQLRYTFAKSKFSEKYFMMQRPYLTRKMIFWSENTVTLRCCMDCEDDVKLPVSTCQVTTDFSERFSFLWPFNPSSELVKKQISLADIPVEINFKHKDNSLDFNFLSNIKNDEELFAWFELSLVNSEGSILVSIPCMSEFRQNNKNDFHTLNFCIPKTEICDEIKIKCEILNSFKSMVKYPKTYLGSDKIAENNISKVNNIVALRNGVTAFQDKESQQVQVRVPRNFHEKRSKFSEKASQQFQDGGSQQFQDGGSQNFYGIGYHFSVKGSQQFDVKACQQFQVKGSHNSHGIRNQFSVNASQQFEANSSQQFHVRGFQNVNGKGYQFSEKVSQFQEKASQQFQVKESQLFQDGGTQNVHGKGYHFSAKISQQLEVKQHLELEIKQQFPIRGSQNFHKEGYQFAEKASQQLQEK